MLNGEELFDFRANSPSFSDSSAGSMNGFEECEDLQLFPDLQGLSEQNNSGSQEGMKKRNIVAVRLDANKERDLIDYLIGKSDDSENIGPKTINDDIKLTNGQILRKLQTKGTLANPNGVLNVGTGLVNIQKVEFSPDLYREENSHTYNGKCMSKNAVAARENRLRKKTYVTDLEQNVKSLSAENATLKGQVTTLKQSVDDLQTEVKYLRNVLANQSTLSALLKNIPTVPGINLVTPPTVSGVPESRKPKKRVHEDVRDDEDIDIESEEVVANIVALSEDDKNESPDTCRGISTRYQITKLKKLDHSYATKNGPLLEFQRRNQSRLQHQEFSTGGEESGVCLHVSGSKVSLEFCAHCSGNSQK